MAQAHYSRQIEMPKTKRDGLANFVQMIINSAEAGDAQEALLKAVDLLEDIRCGLYDDAMVDDRARRVQAKAVADMQSAHDAALAQAHGRGYAEGVSAEKSRLARILGVGA